VPPRKEQKAIANALTDADDLISALDKLIAKKRDLKQAAMQQLLTGKRRLPSFARTKPGSKESEVGTIPEDWTTGQLEEFCSFISYGFTNPMPTVENGVYMITAADIANGRIQFDTARHTSETAYQTLLTAKSKPRKNDILLTKDGSLGRLALVGDEVVCINQSVAVIRPNEKVEPVFLKLLLESPTCQKKMLEDAGGSTIKHIYITIVNLMTIALPKARSEQTGIADLLSDMDAEIAALEQRRDKTRALKQGMMQELLTGKTRLI
jgi:type I restriction enzyme S subunit